MKKLLRRKISELLSLYLDGQLSENETREVEEILRNNESARKELDELTRLKSLLSAQPRLQTDVAFWTRLSQRIEDERAAKQRPRFFQFTVQTFITATTVVLCVALGVFLYERYGTDNTTKSLKSPKGMIPLFSNISKDEALQFSLLGALPFDRKKETVLEVDATAHNGCRIKVGKNFRSQGTALTLQKFVAEIQPTASQQRIIDSLLEVAQRRIASSVLVGENNTLAVDPTLPEFNRTVLSTIAASLEPQQRMRMESLLLTLNAPYNIDEKKQKSVAESAAQESRTRTSHRTYVVITPDTLLYSDVHIDMDSLFALLQTQMDEIEAQREEFIEQFMRQDFNMLQRRHMPQGVPSNPSAGILQVEVGSATGTQSLSPELQIHLRSGVRRGLTIAPSDTQRFVRH